MSCSGEEVASADTELHPTPQDQDRTRVGQQQQVVESVHSDGASTASTHWQHTDLNDARSESAQSCGSRSEHDEPNDTVSDGGTLCVDNDHSDSDFEFGSDDEDAFDFFSGRVPRTLHDTDQEDDFRQDRQCRPSLDDVNDIRVIHIHHPSPGSEDIIRCHFERTSLPDPCDYFALSYAWGNPASTSETILIDGVLFSVTPNLLAALHRLRALGSWIPAIWIDAICIDQEKPLEKCHQVMLMDQIYAKAQHLIVWLGELDEEPSPISEGQIRALVDLREEFASEQSFEQACKANQKLRQRGYFKRRWVIQEVFCCSWPHTVLIGRFRLLTANIGAVLQDQEKMLKFVYADSVRPSAIQKHKAGLENANKNRSLFRNLFEFTLKQCSDDRDIIYALRSISKDGSHLEVNYIKEATSLYISLAQRWIIAGHLKLVLQLAILQRLRLENARCLKHIDEAAFARLGPSWVPIWSASGASIDHFETLPDLKSVRWAQRTFRELDRVCLGRPVNPLNSASRTLDFLEQFYEMDEAQQTNFLFEKQDRSSGQMIQFEGKALHCEGSILAQCKHDPRQTPEHRLFRRPVAIDCAYCFLLFTIRDQCAGSETERANIPIDGTWCILPEASIAFGVHVSEETDDLRGRQAYVLRTPIYDVRMSDLDLEIYDSRAPRPFKFSESTIVTLV